MSDVSLFGENLKAGYMTVIGKGKLLEQPVIVKARYLTKGAEEKIKVVSGVFVLCGRTELMRGTSRVLSACAW